MTVYYNENDPYAAQWLRSLAANGLVPAVKPSTILMRRVGGMLHPADEKAAKLLRRIPPKVPIAVRILRHRNPAQNAMYWAVLERVVEATGRWPTAEALHMALKIELGMVESMVTISGRKILVPESTAYDQMSGDDFSAYMDSALRIICDQVMGGISIDELLDHAGVRRAA